ncbi:16S rRNA (uracil(1498)-N(3))-methyltransferase [Corynebacterium felinum]|uniref:Ribosomal RNA small subunit methyltransferase E n=1 Tax=Corynebacterium felinum TaxID=131318 RepID=A0ABU2B4E8_9CORY|nr:16S rRNA (uracil(1498)-N(3))-methyltransferase [Corynebacterium felinum]MDF5821428.1 16S rRNA (uracil(1498)-N(3))-methyltransferase [Corynebacterium felinum]MDR7353482.1 16S rRNA (uracil1498-N3)-methyltransferase [Corynebacterium felinum]WJY95661.1 Ribosomal RNA small subunit methyltransferase E [Corynebacterium felinum]
MSLPVFIAERPLPTRGLVTLSGVEGRHAVAVKRIVAGEHIELIDGEGARAEVKVTETRGKDTLYGEVLTLVVEQPRTPRVTVVQALPKSERSELAIDLLTQGGVDAIVPWEASRCVAKWVGAKADKGRAKWVAAAQSAAKQSRRATIPHIAELASTPEVVALIEQADKALVLHETAAVPLASIDVDVDSIVIIIGPEGGISEDERAVFTQAGAQAVKLGPEVLRTATAGLVALAAIGVRSTRWSTF